jgi:electron transport complex protein RnfG
MLTAKGYGGDIKIICGIDSDGKIIACKTLEQSETKGLGSRVAETPFQNQFTGGGASMDGVSAISGATISSSAYIGAVKDALTAFELVKEAS